MHWQIKESGVKYFIIAGCSNVKQLNFGDVFETATSHSTDDGSRTCPKKLSMVNNSVKKGGWRNTRVYEFVIQLIASICQAAHLQKNVKKTSITWEFKGKRQLLKITAAIETGINFNGKLLIATPSAQFKATPLVSLMFLLSHFSLYHPSLIMFDYVIVFLIFFNFNPFWFRDRLIR